MGLHEFLVKTKKLKSRCISEAEHLTAGEIYWIQPVNTYEGYLYVDIPFDEAPEVRVINDQGNLVKVDSKIFTLI